MLIGSIKKEKRSNNQNPKYPNKFQKKLSNQDLLFFLCVYYLVTTFWWLFQEDPILIEEIRKTLLISPPQPDVAYNLSSEILSSGQVNQVLVLTSLFQDVSTVYEQFKMIALSPNSCLFK